MASEIVEEERTEEQEQEQQQGQRAPMVQRLMDAPNLPAFVQDLITTQATTVVGTEAIAFMVDAGQEDGPQLRLLAHVRPDTSSKEVRDAAIKAFMDLIKPCVTEGKDGAIEIGQGDAYHPESQYCLVTLLRAEGSAVAVSAVITRCMNLERARQRLTSMQLVAGYFELFTLRHNVDQSRIIAQSHQHVLQLASAVATADGFPSAAMNLCNELANRSGATRIALGWYKGRNIKVRALSHTEEFDKKQELIIQIERAMEECADQEEIVQFDPQGKNSDNVTREAQSLSRAQGGNVVLSLPLRQNNEVRGVITLEFLPTTKLGPQLSHGLTVAVDLLAPQLYDRYQNDRWLITKTGLSIEGQLKHVIGPRYMIAKLIIIAVIVLAAFLTFFKPMYHVGAPFTFEPPDKTVVSSPFEGVLRELGRNDRAEPLRPGDHVKKGQLLAALDTLEPQHRKSEAMAEKDEARKEYEKNNGERGKHSEAEIALAKANAAQARVDLYQWQIDQSRIVAPYDGLILEGDLTPKIGQKVSLGDKLFELAPNNLLRVELNVHERDIQNVKIDAHGRLATDAMPMDKFPLEVKRIIPVGDAKEGSNNFTVYAESESTDLHPEWRPGMTGEARIDVAPKRLAWIWTHRLIDFLRLKLWM